MNEPWKKGRTIADHLKGQWLFILVMGLMALILWGLIEFMSWVLGTNILEHQWVIMAITVVSIVVVCACIAVWTDHREKWQKKLQKWWEQRSKRRQEEKEYEKQWRE